MTTIDHDITEVYAVIAKYPRYSASNMGRVRNDKTGRVLKAWANGNKNRAKGTKHELRVKLCDEAGRHNVLVHRLVAEAFVPNPDGLPQVDHRDGNPQNNHVSNLRWASASQNQANVGKRRNNKSGFIGVTWDARAEKWKAQISIKGKSKHIGYFDDILDAARAYDDACKSMRGEFATTNLLEDNDDPLADFVGQTDRDDDPYTSDDSSIELIDSHEASPDTVPSFESRETNESPREIELISSKSS